MAYAEPSVHYDLGMLASAVRAFESSSGMHGPFPAIRRGLAEQFGFGILEQVSLVLWSEMFLVALEKELDISIGLCSE